MNLYFLGLYSSDVMLFTGLAAAAIAFLGGERFYSQYFVFGLMVQILNHSTLNLYKERRIIFNDTDFLKLLYSSSITFLMLSALVILFRPELRLIVVTAVVLGANLLLASSSRIMMRDLMVFMRKKGSDKKRVVIYGKDLEDICAKISDDECLGYELSAKINDIGRLREALDDADVVFMTKEHIDEELLELIVNNPRITWKVIPSVSNLIIDPLILDEFRDYPLLNVRLGRSRREYLLKRALDMIVAGLLLLLLSPFLLLIAVLIRLDSPGGALFRQERLGKDLLPFQIFKFRTMSSDAEQVKRSLSSETKGLFKIRSDPRVTKIGRILRRTCLDEIPQLFNVLRGEMSIVGPRPHLESELATFSGWRMRRFSVKPGMTGLWQVNGRHSLNPDKAILYDIYYTCHMSLCMDLMIILRTIPAIALGRGRY